MSSIPERGYPLSALFMLMAACAVPMSMAAAAGRALSEGNIGGIQVAMAALGGCTGMMLLGLVMGLHHHRQGMGVIVGGLAGAIIGSMSGPIVMVPADDFPYLALMAVGGSTVMVALATWFRKMAEGGREPTPPAWFLEEHPFYLPPQTDARIVAAESLAEPTPAAPWPVAEIDGRIETSNLRGVGFGCLYAVLAGTVTQIMAGVSVLGWVTAFQPGWDIRFMGAVGGILGLAALLLLVLPLTVYGFFRHRQRRISPWRQLT